MGDIETTEQGSAFERLVHDAGRCRCCSRMAGSSAVLTRLNGDPASRFLFVAEAPGRLGAARSGIPLFGDRSGRNFDRLLEIAGLKRDEVFITNAVLCNPRDDRGRNATPAASEVRACQDHLRRTIQIVDPVMFISLGSVALRALGRIHRHDLTLVTGVGNAYRWHGRVLVPLYHTGARAQIHRSFEHQMDDFARLGRLARELLAV